MPPNKPCKYWMLTIPRAQYEVPTGPLDPRISYLAGQAERGAGGFEHWQLVVCFKTNQRLGGVKSYFTASTHAEPTRSEAAFDYVFKDDTAIPDTRFQLGKRPMRRDAPKDWDSIWDAATRGAIQEIPADIRVRCYSTIRRIAVDHLRPTPIVRSCHVFVGPTGTGKSRRAWEEAGFEAFPKDPNSKFWDGYSSQKHVVIDEFRGAISISHMLRWLDRYPVVVEIKGSSVALSATTIWITSNLHPRYWYPNEDLLTQDALMRRLQITEFE